MQRILLAVLLVSMASPFTFAHAEQVRGLYTTTIGVAGQSQNERAEKLPQAFQQVLVKVTGKSVEQQGEALQALSADANRYVAQFRYVQSRATLNTPAALKLWVQFDKNAVDAALKGVAPIWSSERPLVLALVAYDLDGKRHILSSGAQDAVSVAMRRELKAAAQSRGIPYVLPVYDRQDKRQLRASDIWSGFYSKIDGLQAKYAADTALVMRVKLFASKEGEMPTYSGVGRWLAVQDGDASRAESIPRAILLDVLTHGMGGLAENLATQYAQIDAVDAFVIAETLPMTVAGVNGYAAYRRVLEHLAGRTGVKSVQLSSVGGDEIRVNVELSGDVEQFKQALRLGRYLYPDSVAVPVDALAFEQSLRYRVMQ